MKNVSKRVANLIANVSEVELAVMSAEELSAIKGVGVKAIEEIQAWQVEYIAENTPVVEEAAEEVVEQPLFNVSSIEAIRAAILSNPAAEVALNTKAEKEVKYISDIFLNRKISYQSIAAEINKIYADDSLLQSVIGKLAMKLKFPCDKRFTNYRYKKMQLILSATLVHGLIDTKQIYSYVKTNKEIIDGKVKWKRETLLTFNVEKTRNPLYGLHTEPGVVLQKTTKVKIGGVAQKLSGSERLFQAGMASMPLRLVPTPREVMKQYFMQSKWYQQVIVGKSNEDPILLKARVEELLDNVEKAQQMGIVYLSVWLDYRTRIYYDFTLEGVNPHGKTFQTSQWEMAYPQIITNPEPYYYSAVCIVDGRISHQDATIKFLGNRDYYISKLREIKYTKCEITGATIEDMDKNFYNARLAVAIEDYKNGRLSAFLLSEDATNGGMQNGGIGFKAPEMMRPSNVGGLPTQQDSHENLRVKLGLATRDEAKDVHQPLLHGSSLKTIASVLKCSEKQARDFMIKAYGKEVLNIARIADWGTQAVDNYNSTLMWKTMDGFRAQSIAYTESAPLTIFSLSATKECGYNKDIIHADIPYYVDANGVSPYGSVTDHTKDKNDKTRVDKSNGGDSKLRGLYANITHSIDGTHNRAVIRYVRQQQTVGIFKHDNFLVHGNYMEGVRNAYKESLMRAFDYSPYEKALEECVENFKGTNIPPVPQLHIGEGTKEMIEKSEYFLSA